MTGPFEHVWRKLWDVIVSVFLQRNLAKHDDRLTRLDEQYSKFDTDLSNHKRELSLLQNSDLLAKAGVTSDTGAQARKFTQTLTFVMQMSFVVVSVCSRMSLDRNCRPHLGKRGTAGETVGHLQPAHGGNGPSFPAAGSFEL